MARRGMGTCEEASQLLACQPAWGMGRIGGQCSAPITSQMTLGETRSKKGAGLSEARWEQSCSISVLEGYAGIVQSIRSCVMGCRVAMQMRIFTGQRLELAKRTLADGTRMGNVGWRGHDAGSWPRSPRAESFVSTPIHLPAEPPWRGCDSRASKACY